MMKNKLFTILTLFTLTFYPGEVSSQCCGSESVIPFLFESGVSVGYGIQFYNAEGLNNYINLYNQKFASKLKTKVNDFGAAPGFKFGANIMQFKVDQYLLALKIDYRHSSQKNSFTEILLNGKEAEQEFNVTLRSLNVGFAASLIVTKRFDIKFVDAMISWNNADFTIKYFDPSAQSMKEEILKNPASKVGFSFGAGATFYPFPPYVSLEATGGYSLYSIPEMKFESGEILAETPDGGKAMENFIKSGGFFAYIQLNFVVPFK